MKLPTGWKIRQFNAATLFEIPDEDQPVAAAAPALLEACKVVRASVGRRMHWQARAQVIAILDAAINQAEGRR